MPAWWNKPIELRLGSGERTDPAGPPVYWTGRPVDDLCHLEADQVCATIIRRPSCHPVPGERGWQSSIHARRLPNGAGRNGPRFRRDAPLKS